MTPTQQDNEVTGSYIPDSCSKFLLKLLLVPCLHLSFEGTLP